MVGSATGSGDVVAGDADSDATSNTLVLDNDYLTYTGTVLVDALAELELTNATTIDGNNVSAATFTVHGELESVAGVNTIKNFSGTHFTSDGTIEVVGSATGSGDVVAGDADSDATSNTLVLDNDYLT